MQPTTIILIELVTPSAKPTQAVGDASWLLRACVAFPDRHVLAFGAPGIRKDKSLGRLFPNLAPDDGAFTIELGAVLVERLPLHEGASEAVVSVAGTRSVGGRFCISNAMKILRYRKGAIDRHALCPAFAVEQFRNDHADEFAAAPHEEFVGSVVTARYSIAGGDADEALSMHLESCVDDFLGGINRIVAAAIMTIDPTKIGIVVPVYDRGSFPWIYLLIRGAGEALDAQRVSTSLLRTTLVSHPLDTDRWTMLEAFASGARKIDVPLKAVRMAESYIQAGAYDFALLLAAIAAEVATTTYVHTRLVESGVSKTRLAKVEKDLTFSVMLNTQLTALAPADEKPDVSLLARIDALRKARNELMHEGTCALERNEVVAFVRDAAAFVDYVASLRA